MSSVSSGLSGATGCVSNTSNAAPAIRRVRSASTSGSRATTDGSAALTRNAVGFIRANISALSSPRVSGVAGACTQTKSARAISSPKAIIRTPSGGLSANGS